MTTNNETEPILELRNVEKHFEQSTNIAETLRQTFFGEGAQEPVRAVDGVNLELAENQVHGIIGESGCGKSTLLLTLMGEHEPTGGEILYNGQPISEFDKADWKALRRKIQVIFQDPFNTMNPHFTVRETLKEPFKIHGIETDEEELLDMLETVRLTPAEEYIDRRESQLSGGEKQRVSIARALILEPDVVLADEPVSMLDVSTQASILKLLSELTEEYDVAMFYVSHDLSTVSYVCDEVNVMYLGRIVESAPTRKILSDPKHPYTQALINAIPVPDPFHDRSWTELDGTPGDPQNLPSGCRFKDRCPERMDVCDQQPAFEVHDEETTHQVACHLYDEQPVGDSPIGVNKTGVSES
ncbi:ABC transporter ATP-binding protein [Halostagnicola sp. A-GB9-2]|uniref:ABC transporter ATP-binding protein n=1 Tax=Halostagnicola sp. A-GB9-2 TaxID=3048066 RepID=UPI0024C0D42D|nr:ABC transporter ATP-binding protein [Halostagnicola sp. A-GB9-2]MDJ1434381.1 ABC transporter ATP-binding protein [Halostagnicola sp. A-GB9-2]